MVAEMMKCEPGVQTFWRVQLGGKIYFARTYPGSDLLYVETERRRELTGWHRARLAPAIREAIARRTA